MYDINKVTETNKIPLILVEGEDPEYFYLVSEAFYNKENCVSDNCTIYSCFPNNNYNFPKWLENDLYLKNYSKNYKTIVNYNGKNYEFNFESAESSHECYENGNSVSYTTIKNILNNTWKYFEIVKIIT